jgi:hypothetical protein
MSTTSEVIMTDQAISEFLTAIKTEWLNATNEGLRMTSPLTDKLAFWNARREWLHAQLVRVQEEIEALKPGGGEGDA